MVTVLVLCYCLELPTVVKRLENSVKDLKSKQPIPSSSPTHFRPIPTPSPRLFSTLPSSSTLSDNVLAIEKEDADEESQMVCVCKLILFSNLTVSVLCSARVLPANPGLTANAT